MSRVFVLGGHAEARRRALQAVADARDGLTVTIAAPTRGNAANAMLHALLGEIAERVEWAGKRRSIEVWKRLITAAWLRVEGENIEVLPALDGHGVDLVYTPTSSLSKAQFASLLDYTQAYAAQQGVFEAQA